MFIYVEDKNIGKNHANVLKRRVLIFKIHYYKLSSLKNWKYWDHSSYPLSDRVKVIIKSKTSDYLQFYWRLMRDY